MGQWTAGLKPWFGNVVLDFIVLASAATALLALFKKSTERHLVILLVIMLVAGQVLALLAAQDLIFGTFPQGIDHPAFMFRIREFGKIFPFALGSYDPWWNGGIEHFIGVTSGAQNFGLLNLPLLNLFDIETFYGGALFFWLMIGFPWIGVFSLRAAGVRWLGAIVGGILLCAATRAMFLFFWQSGNVGAMVSSMLSLPVAALGWRIVVLRRGGIATTLTLGILAWLVCIWSPGVFVCIGVGLGWLLNFRHWTRRQFIVLFSAGAMALVLLSPWLWITFFPCRGILKHVGGGGVSETQIQMAHAALQQFSRRLQEWHPLIIFFGLVAVCFRFRRNQRHFLLALIAPLTIITLSIGWKRQSQLDRMAISLAMVCILPAAIQIGRLFSCKFTHRRPLVFAARGIVLALLVLGLRIAIAHCGNAAGFKMWPAQESVSEFVSVVRREVPEDARLAFAGATDWRYEWGKPTFLPILTNREMMADDYYSYPKGLIQYNYPPVPYRKSIEGVVAFSKAYGITHWAVAEEYWRKVFKRTPEHFKLVHSMRMQSSSIDLFKVIDVVNPTRFYEGSGRVEAKENQIDIFPDDVNTGRIVIRYNWREGLFCRTSGSEIMPFDVDENLVFIAIKPKGNTQITIGYRSKWHPLKPNFDGTFHH